MCEMKGKLILVGRSFKACAFDQSSLVRFRKTLLLTCDLREVGAFEASASSTRHLIKLFVSASCNGPSAAVSQGNHMGMALTLAFLEPTSNPTIPTATRTFSVF